MYDLSARAMFLCARFQSLLLKMLKIVAEIQFDRKMEKKLQFRQQWEVLEATLRE